MMNRDQTDAVRFLCWVGTAELTADVGKEVDDESLNNEPGLVFEDKAYIRIDNSFEGAMFATVCGRDEFADPNFMRVAQFLWDNHSRDN